MPRKSPPDRTLHSSHPEAGSVPCLKSDPANRGFQHIEDIATAYWYSQVLFSAVELDLFGRIETGCTTAAELAGAAGCQPAALARLLSVLTRMDLVHATRDGLANSQLARRFLVSGRPDYMGDFILYRRYMQAGWSGLTPAVARPDRPQDSVFLAAESDYPTRNFHYVRAMDGLMRLKARDIIAGLHPGAWCGPILDVGGGAGALCRALLQSRAAIGRTVKATLIDLPEVIGAARRLYAADDDWQDIRVIEGDFRHHDFPPDASFGLVLLSNFLHAYEASTARQLLTKAAALTAVDGVLLIHDYFPDRMGSRPHKGPLYDVNMMLNTFDGACHPSRTVRRWLAAAGMVHTVAVDLASDSAIILAGRSEGVAKMLPAEMRDRSRLDGWVERARQLGFWQAALISTDRVRTAAWPRQKCRFGCAGYGKNRMCPPQGIDHTTMAKMLNEYRWAVLVMATPPGKQFHDQLLALEKEAFLAGCHKALAFGAGPCPVCRPCPDEGACRHPHLARPSMEGSGIDVYETARQAGMPIDPVTAPGRFVKYVGMVLLQ